MTYPIFVSFYCGSQYYYDAAKDLIEDCRRLDIPHDIEELQLPPDSDWAFICRKKTEFYFRKLEEHKQPIFWLDVDTRILKKPEIFENAHFDFAAFLRNFKYFREYDPVQFARTFHPGFLYFNYTDQARAFAARIAELEKTSTNKGTDDFFLQEAWNSMKGELDILLLPPKRILRPNSVLETSEAWFYFGESGNVKEFSGKVDQHEASVFDTQRQFKVLKKLAQQEIARSKLANATVYLKKMVELDPSQDDVLHTLGRVLRRQKRVAEAVTEYETRLKTLFAQPEAAEQRLPDFALGYFDFLLDSGEVDKAKDILDFLLAQPDQKHRNIALNRKFRWELEDRARRVSGVRTKLWWMEQPYPGNFGDIVNPYIVEKLTGVPPKLSPAGTGVLAIGSVIKFAKKGTSVWGTGSPRLTDVLAPDAEYRAVRGPITRRLVLDSGGKCPEVYGDAALLLPFLYRPKTRKRHRLGLIKHFTHKEEKIEVADYVKEIDIIRIGHEQIEAFLDELWECEMIVSTSLHGLIVSHAYGIPAVWATFRDEKHAIPGGDVKFADYFASVGLYGLEPLDLSTVPQLTCERVADRATSIQREPDYASLLAAAPMKVTHAFASLDRRQLIEEFLTEHLAATPA